MATRDFYALKELAERTGYSVDHLYVMYVNGTGPFGAILTKLGKRVGVWAVDYDQLIAESRKLPPPTMERVAAPT